MSGLTAEHSERLTPQQVGGLTADQTQRVTSRPIANAETESRHLASCPPYRDDG